MYEIHELANVVPMASEKEQIALTKSIKECGQKMKALLWQGKIVDGRCRQLACMSLDMPLTVREIPDNTPREEVIRIVKGTQIRRNLTMTQKLVCAYKEQQQTDITNKSIAEDWAVSVRSLQNLKYIAQHRVQLIDPLFNGKSVKLIEPVKGHEIVTNKINTIAKIIRDTKTKSTEVEAIDVPDIKYSVEELPISSYLYPWYQQQLANFNNMQPAGMEALYKAALIQLAKYKEQQK